MFLLPSKKISKDLSKRFCKQNEIIFHKWVVVVLHIPFEINGILKLLSVKGYEVMMMTILKW